MSDFVINVEYNIIINEEDHFSIAYQQMINNSQFTYHMGEVYNEIEHISESNKIENNNIFTSKEESNLFGRSKSLCIITESKVNIDPLNITKKYKSCKCLQNLNLL